jgi:uncharacterized protein (TIGR02996 family)
MLRTNQTTPTSDQEALLHAIIEHPEEDTPRLVYADCLEENGDPDRAKFIRVQIERAQLPRVLTPAEYTKLNRLLAQADRLFDSNGRGWAAALGVKEKSYLSYRRGFLEVLETTPTGFARTAGRLSALTPVREIWFRHPAVRDGPAVRPAARHWLRPVARSPHFERIEGLSLCSMGVTAAQLFELGGCPRRRAITSLDLSETPFLRGDGVAEVLAGGAFPGLRTLAAWFYAHPGCREVEPFAVGPADAEALAVSQHLAALEELDLSGNALGDAGAAALADAGWRLRSLRLVSNSIGPFGALALAASERLNELEDLDLSRNPIGDDGAESLAWERGLPALRGLSLRECGIGNAGAFALARTPHLGSLVQLDLGDNPRISYDAAFALRDRFGDRLDMSPA